MEIVRLFTGEKTERLHNQPKVTQLEPVTVKARIPNLHWNPKAILFPPYYTISQNRKFKSVSVVCFHIYIPKSGYELYWFFEWVSSHLTVRVH